MNPSAPPPAESNNGGSGNSGTPNNNPPTQFGSASYYPPPSTNPYPGSNYDANSGYGQMNPAAAPVAPYPMMGAAPPGVGGQGPQPPFQPNMYGSYPSQSPYPNCVPPPTSQPPVAPLGYSQPGMAPSGPYAQQPFPGYPTAQGGPYPGGYPSASPNNMQQQNLNMNSQLNTVNMSGLSIAGAGSDLKKSMPSTPVELKVNAKNLLDLDTFSKSDPVCIVYYKDLATNQYFEVGRTEQIKNSLNPSWDKKFVLDYRFEERQVFKFSIYDWDGNTNILADHDFLGSLECSLGEIVAAPNKKFERNLELPPKYRGRTSSSIVISAEELGTNKEVVFIKMNARGLDKKDWFGKSDPYVVISKKADDGTWTQVHKTETIKNSLDPNWNPFSVRLVTLISGNPDRLLRFQVYDWDNDGSSDFIGEFETTYNQIIAKTTSAENRGCSFSVINSKKQAKNKKYTSSGAVNIEWLRVEEEKSFLDYIQSGVQIHFTVAVDFTASNGDPNHPSSLHYRNPHQDNQYVIAIKAVGEIIEDYDSDKSFPALGFGGKVPPDGRLSHEFFLNGTTDQPHCLGTRGILDAYFNSLNTVTLYGPTYFAPVINHLARFAKRFDDGNSYFVLLIITDGIICDMDATKEAIIEASTLPMSIIIIGVGQEDFSAMEFLDSDGSVLRHNGKAAVRDIVQFVELQRFVKLYGGNQFETKTVLAKEVLAEIPDQLVERMRKMSALK